MCIFLFIETETEGSRLADTNFNRIFSYNNCIVIEISLTFVLYVLTGNIGLDHGLASNRRQTIIWTNDDTVSWRIYASPSLKCHKLYCRSSVLFQSSAVFTQRSPRVGKTTLCHDLWFSEHSPEKTLSHLAGLSADIPFAIICNICPYDMPNVWYIISQSCS